MINESNNMNVDNAKEVIKDDERPVEVFSLDDFLNAVRYGSRTHINYILSKDSSLINKTDSHGYTCIHWAAKRGDIEILEELLSAGANLNTSASFDTQMHPLHWAASEGKLKSIKFFLDNRADINVTDANGCNPLIIATQYGRIETVAYLIKNGSDLSLCDFNGDTALHWAAYKGFDEIIGLLLHFVPMQLNMEDNYGQTPLHLAALRGNYDAVQYLISEFGADHVIKDKNGCTPLALTIKKQQFSTEWVIRRLISKNKFDLISNLGISKLIDRRVFIYLFIGSNDLEVTAWIWRVSFISNFIATYVSIDYATSTVLVDYSLLHVTNITLQCLFWILFTLCLWKSPTYVTDECVDRKQTSVTRALLDSNNKYHPNSYNAAIELMGTDAAVMGVPNSIPPVCHTCRTQKPLRSKHCKFARKCVLKFDHFCNAVVITFLFQYMNAIFIVLIFLYKFMNVVYIYSPYIYNSVGRDNYKYFVAVVVCFPTCSLLFLFTSFLYWYRAPFHWSFYVFLGYTLLMLIPISGLASYHLKLLMTNMTTNEEINAYRYPYFRNEFNMFNNPFDRGNHWKNALDGLFPKKKLYYSREEVRRDIRNELQFGTEKDCNDNDEHQSKLLSEDV